MGRHRRSAATPVADDHADGSAGRHRGGARRKKRGLVPVRTGLLGASAAMAVGAVAVTTGLLPGGDKFTVGHGNDSAQRVRAEGSAQLQTQGDASAEPTNGASAPANQSAPRPQAPSKTPSPTPTKPSATPSKQPKAPEAKAPEAQKQKKSAAPARTKAPAPERPSAAAKPPVPSGAETAAAAESKVLRLVNEERAKVGCSPVQASAPLAALAGNFSDDMAARGFFDHTSPEGATPWDRADKAGVQGLGGENIARGQADAVAVMTSWMNSDGHRANILNCDYKTMGVGVHLGAGGPWWTQDFGF
ncbi:CAP domain-containing protein [Streptomyces sp. NPDC060064]|uniref:CAP domain-containing protein n=1 Tax=Streptomyces sp. NPDC060064 TaxID=3347049 RepID=UPI003690626A